MHEALGSITQPLNKKIEGKKEGEERKEKKEEGNKGQREEGERDTSFGKRINCASCILSVT